MPRTREEDDEEDLEEEEEEDEDDADDEEEDDEDEPEEASSEPVEASPEQRPARRRIQVNRHSRVPPMFGSVPDGTTMWGIKRVTMGGSWEPLSSPSPDGSLASREWPLEELTLDTIRQRWGAGHYRVEWLQFGARGGLKRISSGRQFEVLGGAPAAPAANAAPLGDMGLPPMLQQTFALMAMLDQQTNAKIDSLSKLAGRGGGVDAAQLMLLFQSMQQSFQQALQQQNEQTRQMIGALERRLSEYESDEDEPTTPSAPINIPRMRMPRDAGFWDVAKSVIAANPEKALEILSGVPGMIAAIAAEVAKQKPQPAEAPAPRPRATVVRLPQPAAEQAPVSSGPGLNQIANDRAAPSAAPDAPAS